MSAREIYRIQASIIQADRAVLLAIMDLHDYAPPNLAINTASLQQLEAAMILAQQAESRALREIDVIRAQAIAAIWAFHEAIKSAKAQVMAQYGANSIIMHAIGLKKVSEYKRPTRKPRAASK
ncbi:MAG: hypothetical protein HGA45_17060 [Chloroflexales bacterium]|nr:hypothetical protein [Chloroflexales bacterium]